MTKNFEVLKLDDDCKHTKKSNSVKKTAKEVLISPFLRPTYEKNLITVVPYKGDHSTIPYKVEPNF